MALQVGICMSLSHLLPTLASEAQVQRACMAAQKPWFHLLL